MMPLTTINTSQSTPQLQLDTLPDEILTHVAKYVAPTANLIAMTQTSSRLFNLFQPELNALMVQKVTCYYDLFNQSAYRTINSLLKANVRFLFIEMTHPHIPSEKISLAKLALKNLDVYLCHLIWQSLTDDLISQTQFIKLCHEMNSPCDLQPLFDAYNAFQQSYDDWQQGQLDRQSLIEAFKLIGFMQEAVLPRHLLAEMCADAYPGYWFWNKANAFNLNDNGPETHDVFVFNSRPRDGQVETLEELASKLGTRFTLVRYHSPHHESTNASAEKLDDETSLQEIHLLAARLREDFVILQGLYQARIGQQTQLLQTVDLTNQSVIRSL